MEDMIVISSYPVTVVIGNHRWRPGRNRVNTEEAERVHWPSVERDLRLQIREEENKLKQELIAG